MAGRKKLTLQNADGVWQRADGRFGWEFEGRFPDGTAFRKAGSRSTLEDAHASYLAAKTEFSGGPKLDSGLSFRMFADACLDSIWKVAKVSPRQIENHRSNLKHVPKEVARLPLELVTKSHVRSILQKLEDDGNSWYTRRNVRNTLSAVYRAAQSEVKGIKENPAAIEIGQRPTRDAEGNSITHKRVLTADEQQRLLAEGHEDPYWIGLFLGLKLGLRRGEILALRWQHVDFKLNVIHIRDNVQRSTAGGRQTRDTKTKAGTRRIPMPVCVADELQRRLDRRRTDCDYVMASPLGCPSEPRKFSAAMEIFRVSAKLCDAKNRWGEPLPDPTLHDLRHTFASVMANELKVGPRVLMQLMGHERIETTLGYYVEASDEALAEAMKLVA